ncbi:MAG TPA: FHA domain-containing protein [Terriglobales bacterium]|nr:FHA domain-containing protein [Terriglobales bacterium]
MTCRSCGRVNYGTAAECALCGKPLLQDTSTPPIGSGYLEGAHHWLVGEQGENAGKRFEVTATAVTAGRHPTQNQIVLNDPEVSRIHARFSLEGGRVMVEDSSANGTYVNDSRIERATLHDGDRVRFGHSPKNSLTYEFQNAVAARAAAAASAVHEDLPKGESRPVTQVAAAVKPSRSAVTVRLAAEDATAVSRGSLQLVLDQYAVENIPLTATRLRIGRAPKEEGRIQIVHPTISENHAEITATPAGATVRDLASSNGTFVNGQRVSERLLQDGDLIQFGDCDAKLLLYRHPRRRVQVLRDLELTKPVVVLGRDSASDIRLDHPSVSRAHAEIRRTASGYEVLDKDSDNGTFVNGMRIKRQALNPRDKLALGAVQLLFDGSQLEQQSDGTRVRLVAQRLKRTVKDQYTQRPVTLVDDVSLVIEPREFVGLLGPVGSGKSTLMHALNGFQPADSGRVLMNSASLYDEFRSLRSLIGYVPQDDILHKTLTVRECLNYAGRLRLPDDSDAEEIRKRVAEVVELLDLGDRLDVAVGELSGGQRKRVNVAIELLSKPSLLFLDEPTAGQDPRTEMRMMQLFRQIANRGSTVVLTTHLLSSFTLLDKIAVLAKGKLAYYGPGQEMLHYFQATRPHEVYEKLLERDADEWARRYRQSELAKEFTQGGDEPAPRRGAVAPARPEKHSRLRQFGTLAARQFASKLKDWKNVAGMLVPPVAIAALTALIAAGPNEPKTLLMVVFAGLWFGCSFSVREVVDEISIYRRERQRGLSILSYLGSKLAYLGVVALVQSALFVTVLTVMNAQSNHYLGATVMMWVMTMQGVLLGLLISALARNADWALYVFPLALIPQLLLAGLLIPVEQRHPFNIVKAGESAACTEAVAPTGYCREDAPAWTLSPSMPAALRYGAAPLMAARWGLEALSDLYVHDYSTDPHNLQSYGYSFQDLGAVHVTFHADDEARIRKDIDAFLAGDINASQLGDRGRHPELAPYAAVLSGFAFLMLLFIMVALKGRDHDGSRL